jgi:hypothetical protein
MADQRISELTEIVTVAVDDVLPIVDVSESTTKKVTVEALNEADPNRPTDDQKGALTGSALGPPPTAGNPFVTTEDPRLPNSAWTDIDHSSLTFTSNSGTWSVDLADLSYFKWLRVSASAILIKGAFVATTISGAGTELRITGMPNITFNGHDSFGFNVWSVDGFANQQVGQAISRVTGNRLAFKKNDGTAWGTATDLVAVIFNMVCEVTGAPGDLG